MPPPPRLSAWLLLASALAACNHEPPLPGQPGERLVLLLEDPPRNLDPRFTTDATSMRVSRLVFQSLITVDNPELLPEPQLADRWEVDPSDDRVWTVHLKQGVRWHDGEPFDADDVVYTYRSVMDEAVGSPFRSPYQAHLTSVEAVDPTTVRFVLREPYATFVTDLVLGIVPEHVLAPNGDRFPEGSYVGTGAYRFAGRHGERRMDLVAASDDTRIRYLVLRTVKDEGTRLLALLGGSADMMQNGLSPVLADVLEDDPRLRVTYGPSIAFSYVALNLREEALADRRVRQALALAIPRRKIIEVHMRGHATLATGMLAPFHWAYAADCARYDYDPARARELLAEAGWGEGGRPLQVTIKISTHRLRRVVARTIAQAWREAGVDASVRSFEFGTFFADIKQGNFQAYLLDVPEPGEPDMYYWMLHGLGTPQKTPSPGPSTYARADRRFLSPGALDAHVTRDPVCRTWQWRAVRDATRNWVQRAFDVDPPYYTANRMFYSNPLVDCRLDLGRERLGPERRRPLYREVQRILATDLPVIPLWHPHVRVVSRKRVVGFEPLPNLRLANLPAARLEEP